MPIFRQGPGPFALAVAMTGVTMGERLLEIGAGTPAMFGALAAKVGLSGRAAAAVGDQAAATSLERAGAQAGALVDVVISAPDAVLPYDDASFDLVVVDSTAQPPDAASPWLGEAFRALRVGGRLIVVERLGSSGLRALFLGGTARQVQADAAARILEERGFRPVRTIAQRDGWRFTEGIRPRTG
jgi:SAM-dependent methyltransferase